MKEGRKAVNTRLSEYEYGQLEKFVEMTGLSKAEVMRFALLKFEEAYFGKETNLIEEVNNEKESKSETKS